jgi:CRISPR/Cas system-associated exonuclease Cas4 (RecB family)
VKFNYCPPVLLEDLKSVTHPSGKRFYTLPDGTSFPSVTTVIGAKPKPGIIAWRKSVGEEVANRICAVACNRGTKVHELCENYLNNEPLGSSMPDALQMFQSIKPILNNINDVWYQEQALYSKTLGMAGRVDCVGHYNGVLSIIDFKTSKKPKKVEDIGDYFLQTTAYAIMVKEMLGVTIHNSVIIMAVQDDEPLVFESKTKDHMKGLLESIQYYRKNQWNKI